MGDDTNPSSHTHTSCNNDGWDNGTNVNRVVVLICNLEFYVSQISEAEFVEILIRAGYSGPKVKSSVNVTDDLT